MTKYFLQMNLMIEAESEEEALRLAKTELIACDDYKLLSAGKFTLVRDGDRSSKNLLATPIEGRFATHLSNKKVTLEELFAPPPPASEPDAEH